MPAVSKGRDQCDRGVDVRELISRRTGRDVTGEPVIVSDQDFAPNMPGIQNVWIQGVGCAKAIAATFSGRPGS